MKSLDGRKDLSIEFIFFRLKIALNHTPHSKGTKVFDWQVPKEWNIQDAYIITPQGNKICDFKENNLHIVNYSCPIDKKIGYDKLITKLMEEDKIS